MTKMGKNGLEATSGKIGNQITWTTYGGKVRKLGLCS